MFKQIFKRIENKGNYLDKDYTKIHWLPYRGLQDISFHKPEQIAKLINNDEYYFTAFVRDPLERLVSGYIDKCERKRGVNLCDYARWGDQYKTIYGPRWDKRKSPRTPPFQMWADGLLHCPCWPETDKHFAPQYLFCNLWQFADRFDLFRFEIQRTSSCMDGAYGNLGRTWKIWMENWPNRR